MLAIAAGIVDGMNLGNNCKTALVAQGCSEIRWLATKVPYFDNWCFMSLVVALVSIFFLFVYLFCKL